MNYSVADIARIIQADVSSAGTAIIEHLLFDSRKVYAPATSLFFAIKGSRRNGHHFIGDLYKKGVRHFVVSEDVNFSNFPEAIFLVVNDTLDALQQLAVYHRQQFDIPVIGITGSNGKTMVKEWLYQLLHPDHNIIRSPKSYNSQIGVPLSVWQMNEHHTLAIFEAGISEQGEMFRLERMIKPTIGVLTNIGEAHSEGFNDDEHKFREKMVLFKNCDIVIGRSTDFILRYEVREVLEMMGSSLQLLSWGEEEDKNEFVVRLIEKHDDYTSIVIGTQLFDIPFTDDASIENAITCFCVLKELNVTQEIIAQRMKKLHPVNMRLELKKGINHCALINDSYSADLSSLDMALDFLDQQSRGTKKTVILSDLLQTGVPAYELYRMILDKLQKHHVTRLIGIGEKISNELQKAVLSPDSSLTVELFTSTENYLRQFRSSQFREETILVKGARVFGFEQIVQLLEQKVHQTLLEINLNAIVHNLKQYQALLKPSTKVMAMVKAFAYGSGGAEIAGILQYHKVDYLGVAYTDEGVELRRAGILLPIMVMNPEESSFDALVENNLEPEIYSFKLLEAFNIFLQKEGLQQYPVHIEIETGMNRLGFAASDMERLGDLLNLTSSFKIQTVFSHLAASEEASQDKFTQYQYQLFIEAAQQLQNKINYSFDRHISNTAAILRHPNLQSDMIRLGIGMYGVDSSGSGKLDLQTVATLKSTVAQLKQLKKGESVSYNRKGIVNRDSVIATVRLGYADGYSRRLGNGVGSMYLQGQLAPVIGSVCMDMTMVDVTGIPGVQEGDEVIVFGKELPVEQVAAWAGTIPYEIMTGISQRVKRVYFEE